MSCHQFLFRTICLFVCLLSSALVSAQDSKPFRVDSYIPEKFTDLEWRVDGRFDANGSSSDYDRTYIHSQGYSNGSKDESRDQLRLNGASTLRYTFLTVPRFFNCLVSFEPMWVRDVRDNVNREKADNPAAVYTLREFSKSESGTYALYGAAQIVGGQYLAGDLFLQGSASSSMNYQSTYQSTQDDSTYRSYDQIDDSAIYKQIIYNHSDATSDRKDYRFTGEVAVGWGRMHIGEYAATSLNIVDILRKSGLLDEEPSYEQMVELTRRVYELRRKHAIDDRLRRIEALQEIIGYLQSERLIGSLNARQGLLIQDVWDYYPRNKRVFGTQIVAGYGSTYYRRSEQSGNESQTGRLSILEHLDSTGIVDTSLYEHSADYSYRHDKDAYKQSYLYFRVDHQRPLNTHWQLSARGSGRYYLNEDNSDSPKIISEPVIAAPAFSDDASSTSPTYADHYAIEGNASLEWLLDSRTSFSFGANYSYSSILMQRTYQYFEFYSGNSVTILDTRKESRRYMGLSSNFAYRISVPTTISLGILMVNQRSAYEYSANNKSEDSDWTYRVSVSLQHYLF